MMQEKTFLFLQGPHGPFFDELSQALQAAGCRTFSHWSECRGCAVLAGKGGLSAVSW